MTIGYNNYIQTVGQLKEKIAELPDDTKILTFWETNGKSRYLNQCVIRIENMQGRTEMVQDEFDYCAYEETVFNKVHNGEICLIIQ